jgi:uncharacterized protein (TIGR01777 family)
MKAQTIVIAGGNGFLGGILTKHFAKQGHHVRILSRRPADHLPGEVTLWNGTDRGDWERALEGTDVLINLCGATVNCRYHARNRKRLLDSRLVPTRLLAEAADRMDTPPPLWLQASTATLYQHTHGPGWNEDGDIGADPRAKDAFSIELASAWEDTFRELLPAETRGVMLRSAMVLGRGHDPNNVLATLARLVRFGLGGTLGRGDQYVSWIHEVDFCRAVQWILEHPELEGPVNLSAPNPLPNRDMMRTLRKQLGRPFGLPAPEPLLEFGAFFLRTETELVIKSRRVLPGKLLDSGFPFQFPTFPEAAENLLAK